MKKLGDVYILQTPWRTYTIYQKIEKVKMFAIVKDIATFTSGKWNSKLPAYLEMAVQVAMKKAGDYHCRIPYFAEGSMMA